MFDAQNDRRQEPLEDKPKASLADTKFKKQIAVIVAVAVLLIVGIIAGAVTAAMRGDLDILPSGDSDENSKFFGLQNPDSLKDLDPITAEDRLEEFQSRPPVTDNDSSNIEKNITRFLNAGDFSGLASYLQEQEATFGVPDEEAGQAVTDWTSLFPLLRGDTQVAINLIDKAISDPAPQFKIFSNAEILAATTVWAPISMKIDAFIDWSALVLPPPDVGTNIQLTKYEYEDHSAKLAEITEATGVQYNEVCSYDAVVTGHQVRITMVKDGFTGRWSPFSVQDIGGTLNSNSWTKAYLKNEVEPRIPYRTDLDDVCFLSPPDGIPNKDEHPEWYNEEGVYIGPGSEYQPPIIEQPEGEGEAPAEGETPAEGEPAHAEETQTPEA